MTSPITHEQAASASSVKDLPAPYNAVEVLTQTTLGSVHAWLKANPLIGENLILARIETLKGTVNFYAKLPRKNDTSQTLVVGYGRKGYETIHWRKHRVNALSAPYRHWDRKAAIVVLLQSAIDEALDTYGSKVQ